METKKSPQNEDFKFKAALFYSFSATILFSALGVAFFRDIYFIFAVCSVFYAILKYTQMTFIMAYVNFKFDEAMSSFRRRKNENHCSTKEITHVFILPNFNEDEQLLNQSIVTLASHPKSKDYCLFLAMQKHEIDSELKAQKIVKKFSHHFRLMSYSIHELQQGECKAKTSNINWCARVMSTKLIENFVNLQTVMVTIMDSDSIIPEAYVDQLQKNIQENYQKRHLTIYQPPQIFSKNQKQAAFFVRIMDSLMSFMHVSNLYSVFGYTMGVSNYTLSYRLLQRIDFWDTCLYSKGEDVRITSKAMWKTQGQTKTCPIYIPINQMNLVTGQGIKADFSARLLQAKRHSQDQVQVSYNLVNMIKSPISLIRKLHVLFTVCEVYIMSITIPIPAIVLIFQDAIPLLPRSQLDSGTAFMFLNNIMTIVLMIAFALFEIYKRKASRKLYNVQPMGIFYGCQAPLLQLPMVILFGFYPMVSASISLLRDRITFSVTPKTSLTIVESESIFQSAEIQEDNLVEVSKEAREGTV